MLFAPPFGLLAPGRAGSKDIRTRGPYHFIGKAEKCQEVFPIFPGFLPPEAIYNIHISVAKLTEKLEFVEFSVIAHQSADWCGNPPDRRTTSRR